MGEEMIQFLAVNLVIIVALVAALSSTGLDE